MVVAVSVEPDRLLAASLITGWGLLAIAIGSIIWTNFGGVADFSARHLARLTHGLEATHRRNTVSRALRHARLPVGRELTARRSTMGGCGS